MKRFPQNLWMVRHGQSAGNVARDAAEAAGLPMIDIAERDVDVPLSALGEQQSRALGAWFGSLQADRQPTVALFSPYLRARQSANLILDEIDKKGDRVIRRCDERLREKEFGILDRLTVSGIRQFHPALSDQRAHVGKFYFRPPGGESWCDVILRLRSAWNSVLLDFPDQRVLIVAHQVTVLCLRYLLEGMDEQQILAIDREGDVPNCGVTSYQSTQGESPSWQLQLDGFVAPLQAAGTPVTTDADAPAAAKP